MPKYTLTFVTLLIAFSSTAQFSVGVEAGANISTVQFTNLDEADPGFLPGAYVDVAPRYTINEKMSTLVDVQYTTKGHKNSNTSGGIEVKKKYTYLSFSPQFEYLLGNVIGLSAGPYFAIKLYEGTKYPDQDWINTSELDLVSSTDLGVSIAVRAFLNRFYLKAAYEHGLADIGNVAFTDANGQTIDNKTRTRNIQLGVGYLIGFGK